MDMNLQALRGGSKPNVVLYQYDQDREWEIFKNGGSAFARRVGQDQKVFLEAKKKHVACKRCLRI